MPKHWQLQIMSLAQTFNIAHHTIFFWLSIAHVPVLQMLQIRCSNLNSLNFLSFLQNLFLFLPSLYWLMHILVMLVNIPSAQLPTWETWETLHTCVLALTSHLIVTKSHGFYLHSLSPLHPHCCSVEDHMVSLLTLKIKPAIFAFTLVLLWTVFHFESRGNSLKVYVGLDQTSVFFVCVTFQYL